MKNNFSVYRNKKLVASRLGQSQAHQIAREDAAAEFSNGRTPTYVLKGTFADGINDTKIGVFHRAKKRIYWKFVV